MFKPRSGKHQRTQHWAKKNACKKGKHEITIRIKHCQSTELNNKNVNLKGKQVALDRMQEHQTPRTTRGREPNKSDV